MATTMSPVEVAHYFVESGRVKHRTRIDKLFLKAFIGGIFLSIGGLMAEIVSGGSPALSQSNPGLIKILGAIVFPIGLMMIVLQGQELLTSNMLISPMSAWTGRIPWWGVPYNWLVVFWGNMVGSLFFGALLVKYSGVMETDPYLTYIKTAAVAKAVHPQWHQIFLRGIGCNLLVSCAVWQAAAAKDTISKIYAIWIPIFVFVACAYDHVVANMYSIPLAIMLGAPITVAEYIRKSLIAAFIGNIVGAGLLGIPYVYFYLPDYRADGLEDVEEGQVLPSNGGKRSASASTEDAKHA